MTRPGHIGSGPVWAKAHRLFGSRGGLRAQYTYAFGVWNVIKNKYLL